MTALQRPVHQACGAGTWTCSECGTTAPAGDNGCGRPRLWEHRDGNCLSGSPAVCGDCVLRALDRLLDAMREAARAGRF